MLVIGRCILDKDGVLLNKMNTTVDGEFQRYAIEQGGYAARQLMGVADAAGFASAPYFWSEQFDLRIQSVGSSAGHDQVVVLERDGDKLVLAYAREGTLIAVAGVNTGAILPKYRRLIERRLPLAELDR